jgi:hypothetical protein
MLKIWFMDDRHLFAKIELGDRETLIEQAVRLFREDGWGTLFVRDIDQAELGSLRRNGRRLENGRYGITRPELEEWADAVLNELSFRKGMMA